MLMQRLDDVARHPFEKGWHTKVDSPHLFIDTCVQIWEDAAFGELNRYGVTAYLQTTFRPHDGPARALDCHCRVVAYRARAPDRPPCLDRRRHPGGA